MQTSHLLVTRFNVRVPEWRGTDKNGQKVLDREWMIHRWNLFTQHTIPSVQAQTNKNFIWLVLFDYDTAKHWRQLAASMADIFTPVYVKDWLVELQKMIREHTPSPWVITTRLDNDDSIAPSFMQTIQGAVHQPQRQFLNIPNGWKGDKPIHHTANPFISYLEPTAEGRSVYFLPHGSAMSQHARIRQISAKRLWTQHIHTRNYVND